jgi:hypothetical protein
MGLIVFSEKHLQAKSQLVLTFLDGAPIFEPKFI